MFEDEDIIFNNLLDEPESSLAEDVILGSGKDSCASDICESNTCPTFECREYTCTINSCAGVTCSSFGCKTSDCSNDCSNDCGSYCDSDCPSQCGNYCASQCDSDGCQSNECAIDTCGEDFCRGDASTSTTYTINFYVGFSLKVEGYYGRHTTNNSYTLTGNYKTHINNASQYSFPLNTIPLGDINNILHDSSLNPYVLIRTGQTTVTVANSVTTATVCGITFTLTSTSPTVVTCAGTISYLSGYTHTARTNFAFNYGMTIGGPNVSLENLYSHIPTSVVGVSEKPIYIEVVSKESFLPLQNARIEFTANSGGIHTPDGSQYAYTGYKGYIRCYTSGNTATTYQYKVTLPGYASGTTIYSGSYYVNQDINLFTDDETGLTSIKQTIEINPSGTIQEIPIAKNLFQHKGMDVSNLPNNLVEACLSRTQLYQLTGFSAINTSYSSNTVATGSEVLHDINVVAILPSDEYKFDEYNHGKY